MLKAVNEKKNRLIILDYLRGFFIVVIIADHFSRWPSLLSILSGQAWLWVTAAEGFVAISGLLVGYVRGFKNKNEPMSSVTKKMLRRAALLYIWSIIATIAYTAILWYIPFKGGNPSPPVEPDDWIELLSETITLQYTFLWVHFLTLYAIFLAMGPLVVWLLRRSLAWLVVILSITGLIVGWATHIEALQWQILFFIPSVAGYYLPSILKWWQSFSKNKQRAIGSTVICLTATTIIISVLCTFYPTTVQLMANFLNPLFAKDTISPWRAGMAFLWFLGFILTFYGLRHFIGHFFGWLLIPFGTRSLTAYILHGLIICLLSYFTIASDNIAINTLLGIICILGVWGLLKIPFVQKIVPS